MRDSWAVLGRMGQESPWAHMPVRNRALGSVLNFAAASIPIVILLFLFDNAWIELPLVGLYVVVLAFIVSLAFKPSQAFRVLAVATVSYFALLLAVYLFLLAGG